MRGPLARDYIMKYERTSDPHNVIMQVIKLHANELGLSNRLTHEDLESLMQDKKQRDWKVYYPLMLSICQLYCPANMQEMDKEMKVELLVSFKTLVAHMLAEEDEDEEQGLMLSLKAFSDWFLEVSRDLTDTD